MLDLEGDLTSSNGADRTNAFNSCMKANDPGVKVLKDPTVWTDATAVTDAQNAINAYGSQLKAIYSQWSSPDTGIIPLLKSKGLGPGSANPVMLISDDGVPFEMCDIGNGSVAASQSQPANLYAKYALTYAVDAAKGVKLSAGQPGGGAPTLQNVTYQGDTNLADPIVAPVRDQGPDHADAGQPGRRPARHGHHDPGHRPGPVGQRVRHRARRRLRLLLATTWPAFRPDAGHTFLPGMDMP